MRTAILKQQVKEYYKILKLETERVSVNGNNYQKIKNWKDINYALFKLNEFEFMGDSVKDIFNMGANFMASTETTAILIGEYQKFINLFDIVKAKCEAIISMDNNKIDNDDINYLYVKLPNELKGLDELNAITKGLDTTFNQCPILRDTYKEVNFVGVDVGSSWFVLSFVVPAAAKTLNWIADFIKKCNDIRIQNRTIKKMDLEYLISKMEFEKEKKEELLQKVEKGIESDFKEQYLKEFIDIKIPIKGEISEEDKGKIVHCMSTMIQLLEKGVELYPSINASNELKAAFPKQEEWEKISGDIKLLNDSKNEE